MMVQVATAVDLQAEVKAAEAGAKVAQVAKVAQLALLQAVQVVRLPLAAARRAAAVRLQEVPQDRRWAVRLARRRCKVAVPARRLRSAVMECSSQVVR